MNYLLTLLIITTSLVSFGQISVVHSFPEPPATSDVDFIRTSCSTTLYPDICYNSLAGYASAVQANPARLARLAVGITLSEAKTTAGYISRLLRRADHRAAAALHDCFSNLGDAVDEMRGSLKQLRQLMTSSSGGSFRFQMSNVQTWMSAALTDEETCTDGFDDVAAGTKVKAEVYDKVAEVKKLTSNALALVNSYAEKGMP